MQSNLTYFYHATSLGIAYVLGLIAGTPLALSFLTGNAAPTLSEGALIFAIGGAVLAFPLLLMTLAIVWFARKSIEMHTRNWCLASPFIVVVAWLTLEWSTNYSNRSDLFEYLSYRNVWERGLLAFLCSFFSALVYFLLIKRGLSKK